MMDGEGILTFKDGNTSLLFIIQAVNILDSTSRIRNMVRGYSNLLTGVNTVVNGLMVIKMAWENT